MFARAEVWTCQEDTGTRTRLPPQLLSLESASPRNSASRRAYKQKNKFLKVSITDPSSVRFSSDQKRKLPPKLNYVAYSKEKMQLTYVLNISTFVGSTQTGGAPLRQVPEDGERFDLLSGAGHVSASDRRPSPGALKAKWPSVAEQLRWIHWKAVVED